MFVFVLLLSFGAILESTRLLSLRDPEIWGHLQVGSWILENKSWPQVALFSQEGNLPWMDFNWGYDVVTAAAYQVLGLRALPAILMGFRVALAAITFLLAGGRKNFWSAAVLSVVAQYVLFSIGPVAAFVSLLLFGTEVLLLFEIRRSGNWRLLFVLPAFFFLWANLDSGFVYGIAMYLLFLAVMAVEKMDQAAKRRWVQKPGTEIPIGTAALAGSACAAASLLTPYVYHPYVVFLATQFSAVNRYLPGYSPMSFRQPQDYLLLLLAMAAFLSLGILRSRDLFQLSILSVCAALSFHAQRENWLVTLAAITVIGQAILQKSERAREEKGLRWSWQTLAPAGLAIAMVFLAWEFGVPRNRDALLAKIAESYPARASDFIRQHQLPPPLFNTYRWGSFLTWYLPEYPVAIDGRRGLYPNDEELDYFKVMYVEIPYQSFPPMKQARTLLLDKADVMGEAFRGLPGFHVAYEDDISIVFLHELKE